MNSLTTVRLALAGMFVLGTLTGLAVGHVFEARRAIDTFDAAERGSRHGVFLWSLERKLDLDAKQLAKIEEILTQYDLAMGQATRPVQPEVQALRARMRADIRDVLAPDQRPQFDRWMDQLDAVREKARGGDSAEPARSAR
ncbi:MAG: hypothetical protein U0271_15975 [Polyangiaceae bacterium]